MLSLSDYLVTIVFTESPDGFFSGCDVGEELEGVKIETWFDPDFVERANADLETFQEKAGSLIEQALEYQGSDQVAHDFWYTRNGHGVGFWDGDYPQSLGESLTQVAREMGEVWVAIGCDLLGPPDDRWGLDSDEEE